MASMSRFVGRRSVICSMSGVSQGKSAGSLTRGCLFIRGARTCDVLVQDGIFFNHIVDQAAAVRVEDEHFPLVGLFSV